MKPPKSLIENHNIDARINLLEIMLELLRNPEFWDYSLNLDREDQLNGEKFELSFKDDFQRPYILALAIVHMAFATLGPDWLESLFNKEIKIWSESVRKIAQSVADTEDDDEIETDKILDIFRDLVDDFYEAGDELAICDNTDYAFTIDSEFNSILKNAYDIRDGADTEDIQRVIDDLDNGEFSKYEDSARAFYYRIEEIRDALLEDQINLHKKNG